ncbi:hypothetical protein DOA20_22175 [Salmonella enterica subsp. enterica serovar Newport]|nr:hypothetical protein [Salmonella enterica subsp. enterica serovar Newport]
MLLVRGPDKVAVINWKGKRLFVSAFAGSGKTRTLRRYAEDNLAERMLLFSVLCHDTRAGGVDRTRQLSSLTFRRGTQSEDLFLRHQPGSVGKRVIVRLAIGEYL